MLCNVRKLLIDGSECDETTGIPDGMKRNTEKFPYQNRIVVFLTAIHMCWMMPDECLLFEKQTVQLCTREVLAQQFHRKRKWIVQLRTVPLCFSFATLLPVVDYDETLCPLMKMIELFGCN
ncbi:hypothetical protein Anapl_10126 [Anas platyrhynchos]|uniref:Uncharacterized protein n=1 Tax=Anas platyrhynchos TaxID=8839 RepID=R0LR30_ANAPL|nr:hypothetical protein Anapl_10126 [Anas platyrhynchos]